MQEIEVKILEVDVSKVREQLIALGSEKVFAGEVYAVSLDSEERLKKEGSFIRLRKLGDKIELCFKGPKQDSKFKIREEIQITSNNFDYTLELFKRLGFAITSETKKHRESYTYSGVNFEIDTYPGLPSFLEIEAPTEEEVKKYVETLGFNMEQATNMSGKDVVEYYKNKIIP